jgi:hypothetical protein
MLALRRRMDAPEAINGITQELKGNGDAARP